MFSKIKNTLKFINHLKGAQKSAYIQPQYVDKKYTIHKSIDKNYDNLKIVLGKSSDVMFREIKIDIKKQHRALLCFIDGMVDKALVSEYIENALMMNIHLTEEDEKLLSQDIFKTIKEKVINTAELKETQSFDEIIGAVLSGEAVLFIDNYDKAMLLGVKGFATRDITEPDTEVSVRGPREGFTENLRVNTTLLRRKIKSSKLVFEQLTLGKETHTDICISYIDGIANPKIINEVKSRVNRINTDVILESGYIEQFIEDNPLSFFSTVGNSEKPDKVAARILEGRVAIFCDGSPFALTVPYLFIETMQVSEDYYSKPFLASIVRMFRLLAYIITLLTPALYVALTTFHQEMIPTVLLITMASAREGIPFPSFIEAMLMGTIFELLRESGIRLPRQVGQAVSIVGALVIGDAAVKAGIISSPMVIIGAITAITSFIVTPLLDSILFFRFLFVILSAAFGLFGIMVGAFIMLAHMCSLRSFGIPFLAPLAPTIWTDLKDSFIRAPIWLMKTYPKSLRTQKTKRQSISTLPTIPDNEDGEDKE